MGMCAISFVNAPALRKESLIQIDEDKGIQFLRYFVRRGGRRERKRGGGESVLYGRGGRIKRGGWK
jgi:hypothetical protein